MFGEVVPKSLFQLHADRLMLRSSALLGVFNSLFRVTGLAWLFSGLGAAIESVVATDGEKGRGMAPKRRVTMLLHDALAGRTMAVDQSELIDRVCRLAETPVHAVMVPKDRVIAIAEQADRRELVRAARRTHHARLPVLGATAHHIIGTVDIDALLQTDDWRSVGDRLDSVTNLSPHDTVSHAIARLRASNVRLAIVVDRGGRMLGIVTIQDLLEEVVGELSVNV